VRRLAANWLWIAVALFVCLGVWAALRVVYWKMPEQQRQTARMDMRGFEQGIELYRLDKGRLPESLAQLVPSYLREVRRDPWGHEYLYRQTPLGFELFSHGPDGAPGGGDDIILRIPSQP